MSRRLQCSSAAVRGALEMVALIQGWSDETPAREGLPALRRFEMMAYSGGPMVLSGWPHPVVVDLAGLQIPRKNRPVLKDHNKALIVGHTESISIDLQNHQLLAAGVVSGAGAVAQEVIDSSRNGFPWQASMGANAVRVEFLPKGRKAAVNGREIQGPVHLVRASVLGEISFVALGADDNTAARVAAQVTKEGAMPTFEKWLEAKGFVLAELSEAQRAALQAAYDAEKAAEDAGGGVNADPASEDGAESAAAKIRAEAAAETKRIAAVRKVCAGRHADLEAKAIEEGWDENKTELEVLRAERPSVSSLRREADTINAAAIEAALCMSSGLSEKVVGAMYDDKAMEAALGRDLRGFGIHALLYETIRASGGHVRYGRVDNDTIRAAFEANERIIRASGTGFSTISLSGILGNVANKTLLAAFQAVESTVGLICAETDVNDFKAHTRYRMTGVGVFEQVGPNGELKHADLREDSYSNQIDTFGRMLTLTRKMMIDDDLNAFTQIPRILGRQAALKREEAVYTLLLANANNFFGVAHKNYWADAASVLSIAALTHMEQLFDDQTDADGKPILIKPAILLVPTSLKVPAQQLMTETRVNEAATSGSPKPANNPHAGKWKPVTSPYLNSQGITGSSATAWYLFANPADMAAIEVAYLRGKRTPTIESGETDFNVLGMQWRGYFDFGVTLQEYRAAVLSKGAA